MKNAGQLSMLHAWRPAGLHTKPFTTKDTKIMTVSWSFIKSQKNANIGYWKILKTCVIYLHVFYSDELIPLFKFDYMFQIDTL